MLRQAAPKTHSLEKGHFQYCNDLVLWGSGGSRLLKPSPVNECTAANIYEALACILNKSLGYQYIVKGTTVSRNFAMLAFELDGWPGS